MLDAAQAGDFGVFADRDAARIAFTLSAYADTETSPLPGRIFRLPYPEMASGLYVELLELLPRLLTGLNDFRCDVGKRGRQARDERRAHREGSHYDRGDGPRSIWPWFASLTI